MPGPGGRPWRPAEALGCGVRPLYRPAGCAGPPWRGRHGWRSQRPAPALPGATRQCPVVVPQTPAGVRPLVRRQPGATRRHHRPHSAQRGHAPARRPRRGHYGLWGGGTAHADAVAPPPLLLRSRGWWHTTTAVRHRATAGCSQQARVPGRCLPSRHGHGSPCRAVLLAGRQPHRIPTASASGWLGQPGVPGRRVAVVAAAAAAPLGTPRAPVP